MGGAFSLQRGEARRENVNHAKVISGLVLLGRAASLVQGCTLYRVVGRCACVRAENFVVMGMLITTGTFAVSLSLKLPDGRVNRMIKIWKQRLRTRQH